MTERRVDFGRPSAPQMMPGGTGVASRNGTFGPPPRDPNGGVNSMGAAIGRGPGVIRDYLQKIADTARDVDEINIYHEVQSQLEPGEEVVISVADFNVSDGYQTISGWHRSDPAMSSMESKTITVSKPDQRFAGVCPVNPESSKHRTTEVYVTRPSGQKVVVKLGPAAPESHKETNGSSNRSEGIRYDNNNFDRLRDKDLNDSWDGSFDPRRIA
jgi:hypothetical protein